MLSRKPSIMTAKPPTFAATQTMYHRMVVPFEGKAIPHPYGYGLMWTIIIGFVFFHVAAVGRWWEKISLRVPTPVLSCGYVAALIVCMIMAQINQKPFIYFHF